MGLDMYLTADRYLWDLGEPDLYDKDKIEAIGNLFPELQSMKIKEVSAEIMYWRKANAIHKWFVDNVQDGVDECQKSHVTGENLEKLLETCKAVLASPEQAGTLLPCQSGFFFGDTQYDDWYFDNLKHTVGVLENIVPKLDTDFNRWSFYYRSSW